MYNWECLYAIFNIFYINFISNDPCTHDLKVLYDTYPLNLLPEMNQLVNIEFLFLLILFNLFMVNIIINLNYSQYIPNNRFGEILNSIINRYIKL